MQTIGSARSDRITTITNTTWAEYSNLDLPTKADFYSFRVYFHQFPENSTIENETLD